MNPEFSLSSAVNILSGTCQTWNSRWKLLSHDSKTSGARSCWATRQSVGLCCCKDRSRQICAQVLLRGSISASLYMQSQAMTTSTPWSSLFRSFWPSKAGRDDTESCSQSSSKASMLEARCSVAVCDAFFFELNFLLEDLEGFGWLSIMFCFSNRRT